MGTEEHCAIITQQLQQLLGCEAACFILDCPDPDLRHPLLALLPSVPDALPLPALVYGSTYLTSLLLDEHIRARCDMALQSGRSQCLDTCLLHIDYGHIQSVLIAPLERPAGMLGLCLLAHVQPGGFDRGECNLLNICLPGIAQTVEETLHALYASRIARASMDCSFLVSAPAAPEVTDSQAVLAIKDERGRDEDPLRNGFVSMVGHELRAPLSAIKGYAGLLQAYGISDAQPRHPVADLPSASAPEHRVVGLTPARQQHYLNVIMEQVNHLEVLINDLLDVSRIQAGTLSLRFALVDAGQLCQQVAQLVCLRVQQQYPGKYQFDCDIASDLPPIWADPDRVQQVLNNLLENAIKYSPDGGCIKLSVASQELAQWCVHELPPVELLSKMPTPCLTITIRDSGIGIADHERMRLFKPFARLAHPTTTHIDGAGLGLYITRKLVEAMGGTIVLYSHPGKGTCVTVTLPLASEQERVTSHTEAQLAPLVAY